MDPKQQVSGLFEEHYTDRYQHSTPSVEVFKPDAEEAMRSGEVIPDTSPDQTIGLKPEHQEAVSRFSYKMRTNEQGDEEVDLSGESEYDETYLKFLSESKRRETPLKNRKDARTAMKEAMQEADQARTVIKWDEVPEGSHVNWIDYVPTDVGKKIALTGEEAVWAAWENTSRTILTSATQAVNSLMPDVGSDYYQAWVEMLNDPNVSSESIMRPGIMPVIERPEGLGYDLLGGFMQFMPVFLAANARLSQVGALKDKLFTKGFIAGIPADFLSFDTIDGNLHSVLQSFGEVEVLGQKINLDNEYTRFMASDMADTQLEGRFRNAVEGAFIGVIAEYGLSKGAKAGNRSIDAARKLWGDITDTEIAEKLTGVVVETAKAARAFRYNMADALERKAAQDLDQSIRAAQREVEASSRGSSGSQGSLKRQRGSVGTGDEQSKPTALLPESRQRMTKALTELALARMLKGDLKLGKLDQWMQEMGGKASPSKGEGKEMLKESFAAAEEQILRESYEDAVTFVKAGGRRPIFYSKLERTVLENMKAADMLTGQEIYDLLIKPTSKKNKSPAWKYLIRQHDAGGKRQPAYSPVNPEEIRHSGLETWLMMNRDRVIPKDELVDMVRARRVNVTVTRRKLGASVSEQDEWSSGLPGKIHSERPASRIPNMGEFVDENFTFQGGSDDFDIDAMMDDYIDTIEAQLMEDPDQLWTAASARGEINSTYGGWGREIESSIGNPVIERTDEGALTDASSDDMKALIIGRMMREIDFEDSLVSAQLDEEFDNVIVNMDELGYTDTDIEAVRDEIKEILQTTETNITWMETEAPDYIRERIGDEYRLRDAAVDIERDRMAADRRAELENEARSARDVYSLDQDDAYQVREDSDGDWEVWTPNGMEFYRTSFDDAVGELYDIAVQNEVLDDLYPPQSALQTLSDGTPQEIGKLVDSGFPSDNYSQYTFTQAGPIGEWSFDDKYTVYTMHWANDNLKADADLLEAAIRENADDPVLAALKEERDLMVDAYQPGDVGPHGSPENHFHTGEYAHVRVTYRKSKETGEIIPHIEENQSDYLQGIMSRQKSVVAAREVVRAKRLVKEYDEMMGDSSIAPRDEIYALITSDVKKYKETGDVSQLKFFNPETMASVREVLGTNFETMREWDTILSGTYGDETWETYSNRLIASLEKADEGGMADLAVRLGYEIPDELRKKAAEIGKLRRIANMDQVEINPTPFNEDDFTKQIVAPVVKDLMDRGYTKMSWSRPWSESGSRSSSARAWREIEVAPYVDDEGVERTTAFVLGNPAGTRALTAETDLDTVSYEAMKQIYELSEGDIRTIAESTSGMAPQVVRRLSDLLTENDLKQIYAGTAHKEKKFLYRLWKKMQKNRLGYDSIREYDPQNPVGWSMNPFFEFERAAGYLQNYAAKLPKAIQQIVNEYDPSRKVQDGKAAMLYDRPTGNLPRVHENPRMYTLADATGVEENPYYGMTPQQILDKWDLDEDFFKMSGDGLSVRDLQALQYLKYLPVYGKPLPRTATLAFYIPSENVRYLFNNEKTARNIINGYKQYDAQWIDLPSLLKDKEGRNHSRMDGGVSVLGLIPGVGIPAMMLGGGSETAQPAD